MKIGLGVTNIYDKSPIIYNNYPVIDTGMFFKQSRENIKIKDIKLIKNILKGIKYPSVHFNINYYNQNNQNRNNIIIRSNEFLNAFIDSIVLNKNLNKNNSENDVIKFENIDFFVNFLTFKVLDLEIKYGKAYKIFLYNKKYKDFKNNNEEKFLLTLTNIIFEGYKIYINSNIHLLSEKIYIGNLKLSLFISKKIIINDIIAKNQIKLNYKQNKFYTNEIPKIYILLYFFNEY